MLRYRQVQCPLCDHIFLWQRASYTGPGCDIYRRTGRNEELESTYCPKCGFEMVVAEDLLEGIDIQDEKLERISAIRGI